MIARRSGRIINVTSASGLVPSPGVPGYTGSKWALEGLSETAHIELLPHNVQVVLVEPGMHKTEIFTSNLRKAALATDPNTQAGARIEYLRKFLLATSERYGGPPRRVADVIVRAATARRPRRRYLCGVDAHLVTRMRSLLPQRVYEWTLAKQLSMMTAQRD
jgi:NAD(P)-dependent dehydrogenase (short-subunit alcohol dehydrogenase family)